MTEQDRRRSMSAAMCRTCVYFNPDVTSGEIDYSQVEAGECRCLPPRTRDSDHMDAAVRLWPVVYPGDWCGSYIPDTDD